MRWREWEWDRGSGSGANRDRIPAGRGDDPVAEGIGPRGRSDRDPIPNGVGRCAEREQTACRTRSDPMEEGTGSGARRDRAPSQRGADRPVCGRNGNRTAHPERLPPVRGHDKDGSNQGQPQCSSTATD